jgi:prenyltransferase beta subunit
MSHSGNENVKTRSTEMCGVASQNHDDLTYHMTAHLRMNAVYWGVTALCIMRHKDALDAEETIEYVMSCWDEEAGTLRYPSSLYAQASTKLRDPKAPSVHIQGTMRTSSRR